MFGGGGSTTTYVPMQALPAPPTPDLPAAEPAPTPPVPAVPAAPPPPPMFGATAPRSKGQAPQTGGGGFATVLGAAANPTNTGQKTLLGT